MIFPGLLLLIVSFTFSSLNDNRVHNWLRFENSCKQAIKKDLLSVSITSGRRSISSTYGRNTITLLRLLCFKKDSFASDNFIRCYTVEKKPELRVIR